MAASCGKPLKVSPLSPPSGELPLLFRLLPLAGKEKRGVAAWGIKPMPHATSLSTERPEIFTCRALPTPTKTRDCFKSIKVTLMGLGQSPLNVRSCRA